MKIFTQSSENYLFNHENPVSAVPDVTEWMQEHHLLLSLMDAVNRMKQILAEAGFREWLEFPATAEGKLILTDKAKDVLRANCQAEHWAYFENYLLD